MYQKKILFIAACAGMLLFGITLITLGTVSQDLALKFNLDAISSGTLFSILPFGILVGSFLFGPICDKYGYKLLLSAAGLLIFAGFEGIAFTTNLLVLKIAVFIFGLGGGVINGATNALVSDISSAKKGANLALLGVFFGVGAIGMPLVIGLFANNIDSFMIVALVGLLTLLVTIFYMSINFPPGKQIAERATKNEWKQLFSPLLLLISLVLFFQSSLEAIINNWTTTYLIQHSKLLATDALYALSLHMLGMIIMRVLLGSVMRNWSIARIMWLSLFLIFVGIIVMQFGAEKYTLFASLILSGAGLAAGFPAMLGIIGEKYSTISGKAFSVAFTIALAGNILINYLMGLIIQNYGINSLTTACYVEAGLMAILFALVQKRIRIIN
jgi:FHS family glucose/mannose:H+ symporter-like MFS transporter